MDSYIVGTCFRMCPLAEERKRTREKLVHFYEKGGIFVKEFTRSAAGTSIQSPSDLRTEEALLETVKYLLTE